MGSTSLSGQSYTPFDDEAILQGRRDGKSWDAIGGEIARTGNAVRFRYYARLFRGELKKELLVAKRFTKKEDREIIDLASKGWRLVDIASELDRPRTTVAARWQFHLSPKHPNRLKGVGKLLYTKAEDRELLYLRDERKFSFYQISSRMKRPVASVVSRYYVHLSPAGETRPYSKKWTPAEDERLLHLRSAQGLGIKEVAESFPDRTVGSVQKRFQILMYEREAG